MKGRLGERLIFREPPCRPTNLVAYKLFDTQVFEPNGMRRYLQEELERRYVYYALTRSMFMVRP